MIKKWLIAAIVTVGLVACSSMVFAEWLECSVNETGADGTAGVIFLNLTSKADPARWDGGRWFVVPADKQPNRILALALSAKLNNSNITVDVPGDGEWSPISGITMK